MMLGPVCGIHAGPMVKAKTKKEEEEKEEEVQLLSARPRLKTQSRLQLRLQLQLLQPLQLSPQLPVRQGQKRGSGGSVGSVGSGGGDGDAMLNAEGRGYRLFVIVATGIIDVDEICRYV